MSFYENINNNFLELELSTGVFLYPIFLKLVGLQQFFIQGVLSLVFPQTSSVCWELESVLFWPLSEHFSLWKTEDYKRNESCSEKNTSVEVRKRKSSTEDMKFPTESVKVRMFIYILLKSCFKTNLPRQALSCAVRQGTLWAKQPFSQKS